MTTLAKSGHLAKSQVQLKKKKSLQIEGKIAERLHEIARIKTSNGETELSKITKLKLIPGMPAEVFIKTKDRTALNYLIKPFGDQLNRAFREE